MNDRSPPANSWTFDEAGFPNDGTPREQLAFCLNYSILAPSVHNTQPWKFRLRDDSVELYADLSRAVPVVDPESRELTISCGAALKNLQVALNHFGYEGWIQYLPDPTNRQLLARVRVGRSRAADSHDESMFRAIRRRRTTRLPFRGRGIPRALQRRLIWLASEYGCWLHFLESAEARECAAALVSEADKRQFANPDFRRELSSWIKRRSSGDFDGMSPDALGAGRLLDMATPMVASAIRTFDMGGGKAARDRELLDASPALVVLGGGGDDPVGWLNVGQAMQQMLLRATAEEVTGSFLNQVCEVPDLREDLRALTGRSTPPQLLIRLGYGPMPEPSPRRPLSHVLVDDAPNPAQQRSGQYHHPGLA